VTPQDANPVAYTDGVVPQVVTSNPRPENPNLICGVLLTPPTRSTSLTSNGQARFFLTRPRSHFKPAPADLAGPRRRTSIHRRNMLNSRAKRERTIRSPRQTSRLSHSFFRSVPLGLPNRLPFSSGVPTPRERVPRRPTIGIWRDAWTWMLYSNSKSFPAAIISLTPVTRSSTIWTRLFHLIGRPPNVLSTFFTLRPIIAQRVTPASQFLTRQRRIRI
jgi:hypothetical protein